MLNLLLITDSPKAGHIKKVLQPLLKVIIDVVTDFDQGLMVVFEKRPTTVCIQDQIGGVTGESVARHIQMLLGSSAPTFILLHSGNGKAKAIKGLYEYLIDLSKSNDAVAEDIKNTLKSLLGDQWEKIYIPPKLSPVPARSRVVVSEESRDDADKFVDDFLSDLEMSGSSALVDQPQVTSSRDQPKGGLLGVARPETPPGPGYLPGTDESDVIRTTSDEMADLFLVEVSKSIRDENRANEPANAKTEPEVVFNYAPKPPAAAETPLPAAEFRISQRTPLTEEHIPDDLLPAFDENHRSESLFLRRSVVIALVCAVCAAGGWYLLKQKPQLFSSLKPMPSSVVKPTPVPQPVLAPPLPAFIPNDGHDSAYTEKNPDWERYVGKLNEFRVFTASGRIQAVQVLAVKDAPISETLIKSVLQELVGTPEYRIKSRETKAGVLVERGRIQDKGEIMIYRKNGSVKAFVVSIN